ncbi:DUF5305 domain-containing protein [Natrialbaceae archaeon A-arb3/5]
MIDNPRLDLVLAKHGRTVAIVLAVIGIFAIVATGWAVAMPETKTTTQTADESATSTVHTGAAVVEGGSLWEEGDRVTNSPVYVLNASPELDVEPETRLHNETSDTAIEDGSVSHEVTLRFEASRDGEPFWNESYTELNASGDPSDGVARSSTTIDMDSYLDRKRHLENEIGSVGSIELRMDLHVEYDTGTHQNTKMTSTMVRLTDEAYWLAEPLSVSEDHTHTTGVEQTSHARSPALIGAFSLVGTIALAGAVFVARRSPVDVDAARRAVHEQRYGEWISRGSIPMWIGSHHIALETLEDVVDVAIDANERVVHDRQRGLFAVVNGDVVYYYSERGLWEQTTWPEMNLSDDQPATPTNDLVPIEELSEFDGHNEFADAGDPDGFDDEDVWEQL